MVKPLLVAGFFGAHLVTPIPSMSWALEVAMNIAQVTHPHRDAFLCDRPQVFPKEGV